MAVIFIPSAFAVHEFDMQLDGDVSTQPYSVPGSQAYDWGANTCNVADSTAGSCDPTSQGGLANSIFKVVNTANGDPRPVNDASGNAINCDLAANCQDVIANPATVPSKFDAASFQRDFESGTGCKLYSRSTTRCGGDDTTYSTGSKDTLGIANGGWQCGHSNNVNNKVDINNAYVGSYWTGGTAGSGHHILYAGVEKEKNNGSNDIGVWFLQGSANCLTSTGSNINWSGTGHRNGDVLLVSEFSNGGGVSGVKIFIWRASTDKTSPFYGDGGCIDSRSPSTFAGAFNPKLGGCNGQQAGAGGDCKGSTTGDTACATTNAQFKIDPTTGKSVAADPYAKTVSTPWLASDATLGIGNNQVVSPDFIEAGIDVTALFQGTGETAPSCFNTGVPDTRSAPSVTATLFDYVVNKIGECSSTTVTTPKDGSGNSIPAGGLSIGADARVHVSDHAAVTVTGFTGSFGGTVQFSLCGPLALDSTSTCATGGVAIGDPVTVSGGSADAPDTVLTSVGRYCWRADYSGDGDIPASSDGSGTECFTVNPLIPTLTTAAHCYDSSDNQIDSSCVLGSTLKDTASLTGTAKQPGTDGLGTGGTINATAATQANADSSISWQLFGPTSAGAAQCTTAITSAPTPSSVTVDGDNTSYGPVSYTTLSTDRVGKYTFAASYGGNSPNTSAAPAVACVAAGTNGEQVTVIGSASSSSKQGWLPNDRITLSSTAGTTLKGTLTVTLYYGAIASGSTRASCTLASGAVSKYSKTFNIDQTGKTPTNSVSVFTDNSTFFVGVDPSTGSASTPAGADTDATNSYIWLIHYVDNSLTSPDDRCETSTISHNDG